MSRVRSRLGLSAPMGTTLSEIPQEHPRGIVVDSPVKRFHELDRHGSQPCFDPRALIAIKPEDLDSLVCQKVRILHDDSVKQR